MYQFAILKNDKDGGMSMCYVDDLRQSMEETLDKNMYRHAGGEFNRGLIYTVASRLTKRISKIECDPLL